MDIMKFPLEFRNGSFATLSSDNDDFYAQVIATTMQILPGELILRPEYGVESPEFDAVQLANFAQLTAQYVPEVDLVDVVSKPADDGRIQMSVKFERRV